MYRVFISRPIEKDSCFQDLNPDIYAIIGESFIKFETIPIETLPKANWYFFYSKNGVRHFLLNFGKKYFSTPGMVKIACMGSGTGEEFLKHFDYPVSFTGSGKPSQVGKAFNKKIEPKENVLFFTAYDSLHSIRKYLPKYIPHTQIPIYYNRIKKNVSIPSVDILIFTSPKNVEAFYQSNNVDQHTPVISIGYSTTKMLHEYGRIEVIIATNPSEIGLLKALRIITRN